MTERWRWTCFCGFSFVSDRPQDEQDEVVARGAKCPNCPEKLRAPTKLTETENSVCDYYGGAGV